MLDRIIVRIADAPSRRGNLIKSCTESGWVLLGLAYPWLGCGWESKHGPSEYLGHSGWGGWGHAAAG